MFILSFGQDHSTKTQDSHLFISFVCTRPFDQIQWSSSIYYNFLHDHSIRKIRVLIYIFILFVYDHSTKIRGHSFPLIYSLINWVNISYATFAIIGKVSFIHYIPGVVALLLYFVRYIHGYMKSYPSRIPVLVKSRSV